MNSDFWLNYGQFDIILRLWVFLKSFVLAGFPQHQSGRGRDRGLLCYCQLGGRGLGSFYLERGEFLLAVGQGKAFWGLCGLCWCHDGMALLSMGYVGSLDVPLLLWCHPSGEGRDSSYCWVNVGVQASPWSTPRPVVARVLGPLLAFPDPVWCSAALMKGTGLCRDVLTGRHAFDVPWILKGSWFISLLRNKGNISVCPRWHRASELTFQAWISHFFREFETLGMREMWREHWWKGQENRPAGRPGPQFLHLKFRKDGDGSIKVSKLQRFI